MQRHMNEMIWIRLDLEQEDYLEEKKWNHTYIFAYCLNQYILDKSILNFTSFSNSHFLFDVVDINVGCLLIYYHRTYWRSLNIL